eukprot:m.323915 g.323915  ORF g.323915 m.323915 type:complete len:239 (+) comp16457_c7_seq2:105-821(+)
MAIRSPFLTPLAHPFVLGVALLTISISWVDGQSCSSFVDLSMPVCSSSQRASVNLPNRGLTSLPSATSGCLTGSSTTIGTNLANNQITGVIPDNYFRQHDAATNQANSPIRINLSNNRLTGIASGAFDGFDWSTQNANSPMSIDLSNNQISSIAGDCIKSINIQSSNSGSGFTLDLSNNSLSVLPNKWLHNFRVRTQNSNSPITMWAPSPRPSAVHWRCHSLAPTPLSWCTLSSLPCF